MSATARTDMRLVRQSGKPHGGSQKPTALNFAHLPCKPFKTLNMKTDKTQSEQLIELGIDPKTADADNDGQPAWTAEALLNILPEWIEHEGVTCHIYIHRDFYRNWIIFYENKGEGKGYAVDKYPTLLDAAFNMVVWWKQNTKKGGEVRINH